MRRWHNRFLSCLALTIGASSFIAVRADDEQEELAPIVSSTESSSEVDMDAVPVAYEQPVVDVTQIPSVFDTTERPLQTVSYMTKQSCDLKCDTSCDKGCTGCDSGCSTCVSECCLPWWAHRTGGFGEALYLSAGNSDLIYATEQTSALPNASPTGPLGIANIGEHLGYRVGFSVARTNCSSILVSYARWDGETNTLINATGANVLNSNVLHPSVATTGANSLNATARQLANFQVVDAALRRVYRASDAGVLNWSAGLRYGNLEQGLTHSQPISIPVGIRTATTDIDFDGFGILGGLDGERRSNHSGLLVYGRVVGSLLAGDWKANYQENNQFGTNPIANRYTDFRISPVVDSELGFGWQSRKGCVKITTGYLFNTWFNAVTNRDYIQSVRTGNLLNMDDNLTFSGLTFRSEIRF